MSKINFSKEDITRIKGIIGEDSPRVARAMADSFMKPTCVDSILDRGYVHVDTGVTGGDVSANIIIEVKEDEKLNNTNVIKNISFDQSEILWNIMQLYNDGKPFDCDMTASELKFYNGVKGQKYVIPEPKILFDVFPKQDKIKKIEPLGRLPLEDNSIDSIVIDLPFVISPPNAPSTKSNKEGSNMIFNRFHAYYPLDSLYQSYMHWIFEAYRVLKPNGTCAFKCQSSVTGSVQANAEEYSFMCAQKVGFTIEDKFILEAKARLISSSKIKKQQHARKYTSVFYVFKKFIKKKSKNFNYYDVVDQFFNEEITEIRSQY